MDRQDADWLARYRAGDREALAPLVEEYRRPLFGFILKMTEGRGDADEVFQEVWIRAIRNLDRFRDDNLLGWLFRIAHNLVVDRARRRRPIAEPPPAADGEPGDWAEHLPDRGPGPDTEIAGRDLGRRIRQAVDRLPAPQREVFLMRTEADLPFHQIARVQRVSLGTALARMHYAVRKLRAELKDEYAALAR